MYYEIYENGELINTIVSSEEFVKRYCTENGYTYEAKEHEKPAPTPSEESTNLEQLRADVDYIAMEMGVNL